MRAQTYEFKNNTTAIGAAVQQSLFLPSTSGLTKLNQTIKAESTDFIVIEDIGVTPEKGNCKMQIKIGTTDYFKNPDGSASYGLPAFSIPYPRSNNYQKLFDLIPDIYVLPGQVWDVLLYNTIAIAATDDVRAYVKYTLYDGADAAIATKLLELGIRVTPENVDWYKRTLIERSGGVR